VGWGVSKDDGLEVDAHEVNLKQTIPQNTDSDDKIRLIRLVG